MGQKEITEYLRELGRRGGKAKNSKLTPQQRAESARRAAKARWAKLEKASDDLKKADKILRKLEKKATRKSAR